MSEFAPRDSHEILDGYPHPPKEEGQGVYIMVDTNGKSHWCPSGNELRRVYLLNPSLYLTGPIYVPLSKVDKDRLFKWMDDYMF